MATEFSLSRTAVLDAPAPAVFALLEDFRQWGRWSPFEKVDPDLSREFSGAERGVGARYRWSGNARAGAGTMEIVEATAGRRLVVDLRFTKPFKATNPTTFTLDPVGPDSTEVTWHMAGTRGPVMRVLSRLTAMDAVLARQFDEGLRALGEAASSTP